ncbi:MAG TPA: DNA methyltransferase [Patescibacteria group bacterium]|nr:DNA methyltransferase [Patescibacteria group bacterium]
MRYAFILGRVYTLSLAELFCVFEAQGIQIKIIDASFEALIVETEQQIDFEKFQRLLGGVVKIVKVMQDFEKRDTDSVNFTLQNYFKPSLLKKEYLKNYSGKIQFGISIYLLHEGLKAFGEPKRLGMMIKKVMQDAGSSIRLVLPEFNQLSLATVQVTKNLLLQKGAEIVVIAGVDKLYVGRTLVVQDFEDYGRRDYQRPIRDMFVGMIPPKVAQSMMNLSGCKAGDTILDPFCGLGTLLQEGVLQGYRVLGSDIEKQQISDAEKNLEWFRNRYRIPNGKYHVEVMDARNVSTLIEKIIKTGAVTEVKAVVTEGTLGPPYSEFPSSVDMQRNFDDLAALYKDCLTDFAKFLPPKGRVVMCMPAYRKGRGEYVSLPQEKLDFLEELGYTIKDIIPQVLSKKFKFLKLSERGTCFYDRKDQIVAREIIIFEKAEVQVNSEE